MFIQDGRRLFIVFTKLYWLPGKVTLHSNLTCIYMKGIATYAMFRRRSVRSYRTRSSAASIFPISREKIASISAISFGPTAL